MRASQRLPTAVRTAFHVAPVLVLLADTGTTVGTEFCCCRHCARLRRRVCGIATTFSVVGGWTICSMRSASRSNASARTRPRDKHLGCASAASACALVALFSGTKGLSDLPIHRVEKNSVIWRRKRRHLSVPAITGTVIWHCFPAEPPSPSRQALVKRNRWTKILSKRHRRGNRANLCCSCAILFAAVAAWR